jgi:hypothetical protein
LLDRHVGGIELENMMGDQGSPVQTALEIVFYYPNPMWRSGNWIKNLILFFDGVGLLVVREQCDFR